MGSRGPTGGNVIPKGYKTGQLQNFTPEQMQLFQSLFSQVGAGSQLSKLAGGDQSQFDQLEAPAMQQFQQLQGQLGSRFSGMGMGARKSSGFQNAATSATQDFASQLQSQRMGIQQQALRDLMGMSNDLLGQRPYEQFLVQKQQKNPFWHSLIAGGAPLAGAGLGFLAGGPVGAQLGGQLGGAIGQAFL